MERGGRAEQGMTEDKAAPVALCLLWTSFQLSQVLGVRPVGSDLLG